MSDELLAAIHTELLSQGKTLSAFDAKLDKVTEMVNKHDEDIEDLKGVKNKAYGFMAAFGGIEGAFHYLQHKFHF